MRHGVKNLGLVGTSVSSDPRNVSPSAKAIAVFGALLVTFLLVLTVPFGPAQTESKTSPGTAGLSTDVKSVTPPGALHIPITTGPTPALVSGERLNVSYQLMALNWSPNFTGLLLHIPTVNGVFPITGGAQMYIPITVRNLTIPGQ